MFGYFTDKKYILLLIGAGYNFFGRINSVVNCCAPPGYKYTFFQINMLIA